MVRGVRRGTAIIHNTTVGPGKLELLAAWLPAQPWYRQTGHEPDVAEAGGFRLDDPQGEVGIESMAVTDGSGNLATTYQVPLTYRAGAPVGDPALLRPLTCKRFASAVSVADSSEGFTAFCRAVTLTEGGASPGVLDAAPGRGRECRDLRGSQHRVGATGLRW